MHSKILKPSTHGNSKYHNTGKSNILINYLQHEIDMTAKGDLSNIDDPKHAIFFNDTHDRLTPLQARELIDNNVKGLREEDEKFVSLVISPSREELIHIGNDQEKMREYTKMVMENYAKNFKELDKEESKIVKNLKGQVIKDQSNFVHKQLVEPSDLVWHAVVHKDRYYRKKDETLSKVIFNYKSQGLSQEEVAKQLLEFKIIKNKERALLRVKELYDVGIVKDKQKKPGLNTHIHITVSLRDKEQRITLNPQNVQRFRMTEWQRNNERTFNEVHKFYAGKIIRHDGQKEHSDDQKAKFKEKIDEKIAVINNYLYGSHQLESKRVMEIAEYRKYDTKFFRSLYGLERRLQEHKPVNNPYLVLETGKDEKFERSKNVELLKSFLEELQRENYTPNMKEDINKKRKRRR